MTSPSVDRRFGLNSSTAIKAPCRVAATANLTLSGLQTVDGVSLSAGDRVLVAGQTNSIQNGIYVADTGAWQRDTDFNDSRDVSKGTIGVIMEGSYQDQFWMITTSGTIRPGTTAISFVVGVPPYVFTQSGSGAIARPILDKLRESVSVFDFMTAAQVADVQSGGLTLDVTTAIQKAVNSGAGLVYFPKGAYKITSTILMPLRVSLKGDGGMASTIKCYNCDGLTFSDTGFAQDNSYFYGLGFFGMAGANYTAINCPTGSGTKYGLHFDKIVISDFNQGIVFNNNLYCTVSRCHIEYVNNPITLGDTSTLTHIFNNTIICSGGTTHGGTAAKIGINVLGGSNCEAVKIVDNFIYGFDYGIKIATTTDLNITGNGIDACMLYGIYFTAVQHDFNIKNNFIELLGTNAVAGIFGAPLGSGEYLSQINIEGNAFTVLNGASPNASGIIMNTTVDTYQWHVRVVGNVFSSMTLYDIRLNLPGETLVENNRCMSVLTTSILVGTVSKAPVYLSKNWCYGAISYDTSADVTNGKIIVDQNTTGNTFVPYSGTFTATFTSASGAFGSITYGTNTGYFERLGNVCHFHVSIYTTAASLGTAGGLLYISGLPFAPRTGSIAAFTVSDVRSWSAGKGPSAGGLSIVSGAAKIALYSRATSNGDTAFINATDLATTNPGNILTISGSYLCA